MTMTRAILLSVLLATPAMAQPIIIPLEKQTPERPPPMAEAPPVAPPTAAPSAPSSVAEQEPTRGDATPQESAAVPSDSK